VADCRIPGRHGVYHPCGVTDQRLTHSIDLEYINIFYCIMEMSKVGDYDLVIQPIEIIWRYGYADKGVDSYRCSAKCKV
jgi:hypothetical protein